MPLTGKGREILSAMKKRYGAERGESVFYASANKGTISGVHDEELAVPERRPDLLGQSTAEGSIGTNMTPNPDPQGGEKLPDTVVYVTPPTLLPTRAATGDSKLRSMNEANRAFWAGRR